MLVHAYLGTPRFTGLRMEYGVIQCLLIGSQLPTHYTWDTTSHIKWSVNFGHLGKFSLFPHTRLACRREVRREGFRRL